MKLPDKINIIASGTAPADYPTELFFALLAASPREFLEIPKMYPFNFGWGCVGEVSLPINSTLRPPVRLDMVYLSIVEGRFYSLEADINSTRFATEWKTGYFDTVLIGMAPYGKVALWMVGPTKSMLFQWMAGEEVNVNMEMFCSSNVHIALDKYCESYIRSMSANLPPRDLFDSYMKQFIYRYVVMFRHWDKSKEEWCEYDEEDTKKDVAELDYIEEVLFDGTHDKLHDGGLTNYHQAGKPKKQVIQWHIKKSEYSAYFWFKDEEIRSVFDRFYGVHPETKVDFIIRIDTENKKYELALFRQGLKEPQIIPEDTYQLLVFKNKFEDYRSDNYNQERGAWIW